MKLIARIKLLATDDQKNALADTMHAANSACNALSNLAWNKGVFGQYALHNLAYHPIKDETGLTAQVMVRCIAKVADAYKLDKRRKRTFNLDGAIAYDDRILRWYTDQRLVSIWTTAGRLKIHYAGGAKDHEYLKCQKGESDLIRSKGEFYLFATCQIPDAEPITVEGVLGVDLGIVNLASDSDGNVYSGERVNSYRRRSERVRAEVQSKGTKSAKRKLKKLSGKQKRFQKDTNHVISKHIVANAQRTKRAIAIEDLKGIRSRTRVMRKAQRSRHSNWAFYQLRQYIEYKAKKVGLPMIEVDPRYTSQRCSSCGHVEKANRKTQAEFVCKACGHIDLADHNAAVNLSWAAVNRPIVSAQARDKLSALADSY